MRIAVVHSKQGQLTWEDYKFIDFDRAFVEIQMPKNRSVKVNFLGNGEIEIILAEEIYSKFEMIAKVKGVSVENLLSIELLRVR